VGLCTQQNAGYYAHLDCPANYYASYVERLAKDAMDLQYGKCMKKIRRLINQQVGAFSLLNFAYEARELPYLFRKIRRPQDFRFIDYQFAIMPTLSDIRSALVAYNASMSSLNDRLKRFRSIPCNWSGTETINRQG